MRARASFCVFGAQLRVGGAVALKCLRLLCQYFNVNFPFFCRNLAILHFSEIVIFMIDWK